MSVENLVVRTAASAGFGTGGWLIAQSLDKKQDTIVDLDLDDIPGDIFKGNIEMSSDDLVLECRKCKNNLYLYQIK